MRVVDIEALLSGEPGCDKDREEKKSGVARGGRGGGRFEACKD